MVELTCSNVLALMGEGTIDKYVRLMEAYFNPSSIY